MNNNLTRSEVFKMLERNQITSEEAFLLIKQITNENELNLVQQTKVDIEEDIFDVVVNDIIKEAADILMLNVSKIELDIDIKQYGFDSISLTKFIEIINEKYSLELVPLIMGDYPTFGSFANYLIENHLDNIKKYYVDRIQPKTNELIKIKKNDLTDENIIVAGKYDKDEVIKVSEDIKENVLKELEGMKLKDINVEYLNQPIWIIDTYDNVLDEKFINFWDNLQLNEMNKICLNNVSKEYFNWIQEKEQYKTMHVLVKTLENRRIEMVVSGKGEPVVIIGGIGMTAVATIRQIEELSKQFQVIQVHVPGCGLSEEDGLSLIEISRIVIAALGKLDIEFPMHLIGISWGSMVVQTLAYEYPDKVASMIISNGIYQVDNLESNLTGDEQMKRDFRNNYNGEKYIDLFMKSISLNPSISVNYSKYYSKYASNQESTLSLLPNINKPTLVIDGDRDTLVAKNTGTIIKSLIQDSEYYQFKGAGHFPFMTHHEEYNDVVVKFIKKQEGEAKKLKEIIAEGKKRLDFDIEYDFGNIKEMEKEAYKRVGLEGINDFKEMKKLINKLCTSYIYEYLQRGGLEVKNGTCFSRKTIKNDLSIIPAYEKYFDSFIKIFIDDGIVEKDGETIRFTDKIINIRSSKVIDEEIKNQFPEHEEFLNMLNYCAVNYDKILNGEVVPTSVLFPGGDNKIVESIQEAKNYTDELVYVLTVSDMISALLKKQKSGNKLRILEVGGGSGRLFREIISVIDTPRVEYYFTDIGKYFVKQMEAEKLSTRVKYEVLDISKDITEQGFEENSFDLILGLNVVHATKDIEETLGNLRKALKENGIIALMELTNPERWLSMVWGMLEGWWYFEDINIRTDSPLMKSETWQECLKSQGFEKVITVPEIREKHFIAETSLIIAQ